MLLRLMTIISLFNFILLLISGTAIETALYRSLLVFLALFTIVYLAVVVMNMVRDQSDRSESTRSQMKDLGAQSSSEK